jgi:hypothetical protein
MFGWVGWRIGVRLGGGTVAVSPIWVYVFGSGILRRQDAGPLELLYVVRNRCEPKFDAIRDVISEAERREIMTRYQRATCFARDTFNAALPTSPKGAKGGAGN